MQQIQSYLYPNTLVVQFQDPTIFAPRNRNVYSRPIVVYQGIDNPLQIVVRNQDQKPVNLTGYSLQIDIQDPVNKLTAYSLAVSFTDITKGQGIVTIDAATVNSLDQRIYKLTMRTIDDISSSERPVYIDDNFGVPLDLDVREAYYATTEGFNAYNEGIFDSGNLP
jgi:hypothetical protein